MIFGNSKFKIYKQDICYVYVNIPVGVKVYP